MADNNIPELTLEPTATATAMPELTLDGVPTCLLYTSPSPRDRG